MRLKHVTTCTRAVPSRGLLPSSLCARKRAEQFCCWRRLPLVLRACGLAIRSCVLTHAGVPRSVDASAWFLARAWPACAATQRCLHKKDHLNRREQLKMNSTDMSDAELRQKWEQFQKDWAAKKSGEGSA